MDAKDIEFTSRVKVMRRLWFAIFAAIFAVALSGAAAVNAFPAKNAAVAAWLALLVAVFICGIFVDRALLKIKCPKCGEPFFGSLKLATPASATSFPQQRSCGNCGHNPYGVN